MSDTEEQVKVYVVAEGVPTDDEDDSVPGAYLILVDTSLPAERYANAALDCFHEEVAVGNLDDFTFRVINENGEELFAADEVESYELGDYADFVGPVDPDQVPQPKAPAPL